MNDKKPMPEATANVEPRDFIRDMVQADLARGLVFNRTIELRDTWAKLQVGG